MNEDEAIISSPKLCNLTLGTVKYSDLSWSLCGAKENIKWSKLMICSSKNMTLVGIFTAASIISMGPPAMATEKPKFSVLATEGTFELRKYPSYLVAETYVEGDFEAVGGEGFRRLADYIGGKNQKKETISMTAPVSQKPASEKIAMTAPVSQARENGRYRIAFMMPSA